MVPYYIGFKNKDHERWGLFNWGTMGDHAFGTWCYVAAQFGGCGGAQPLRQPTR